jgi:DNA replication protein DnaC
MKSTKINTEIKEYCKILRLNGIGATFEEAEHEASDYEDFLHRLLTVELQNTEERAKQSRIRTAKFPYKKYLEDLEPDCLPEGMRKRLPELSTLDFVKNHQNLILTGNPGTGKTHTAIGLGIKACEQGYRVLFTAVPYLVTELKECTSAKKLKSFELRFEKYDLVIADELGYVSFDREGADLLFTNLSLRASQRSTLITSNLTFERWDEVFGDAAITSAIVDRLTYKAILVDMEGDSYRFRETLRTNGASIAQLRADS